MAKGYKNPSHYRLELVKENSFMRIWSIRMRRTRMIAAAMAVFAGLVTLLWTILVFSPIRRLLPVDLGGDLRNRYLETAMRLDSLEHMARLNDAYIANIVSVMSDNLPEDSVIRLATEQVLKSDSMLMASETERQFVRDYEEEERFNLSVLSPIAAEGMVFSSPVAGDAEIEPVGAPNPGIRISGGRNMPLSAVYRGTVIAVTTTPDGTSVVAIQHPNDFISTYAGLGDVFVAKGRKVAAGQRLGHSQGTIPAVFELWHNGTALNPGDYIAF